MARRIIESVLDDIDGTEDAETVTFAFDGKQYEIDLADKNRKKLEDALAPFINAGRKSGSSRSSSGSARAKSDTAAIRAWATENGIDLPSRGRIPASVLQQYKSR